MMIGREESMPNVVTDECDYGRRVQAPNTVDTTVPMAVVDDITTYVTIPDRVEETEEISDGRPSAILFEKTRQFNTVRMVLPVRPEPRQASGELSAKPIDEWGTSSLEALERLFVLQAMLEAAHLDLHITVDDDPHTMDGPPGVYDMETAPKMVGSLPIGDAIPLRRETLDDSIDGVKMIIFRLGMLATWLTIQQKEEFSSIRPNIPVPLRQSALRFLRHVTKVLNEYSPNDPLQPTILEISAS